MNNTKGYLDSLNLQIFKKHMHKALYSLHRTIWLPVFGYVTVFVFSLSTIVTYFLFVIPYVN